MEWRKTQPNREQIFIHHGDWNEVLKELVRKGILFDAIAYDAFPLEAAKTKLLDSLK